MAGGASKNAHKKTNLQKRYPYHTTRRALRQAILAPKTPPRKIFLPVCAFLLPAAFARCEARGVCAARSIRQYFPAASGFGACMLRGHTVLLYTL